jgi:hypothetical protein
MYVNLYISNAKGILHNISSESQVNIPGEFNTISAYYMSLINNMLTSMIFNVQLNYIYSEESKYMLNEWMNE